MPERRHLKAIGALLAAFAAGLALFFLFSSSMGDGLDRTMENAGVEDGDPVYKAPFDYGGNYPAALAMGMLGFFIVLAAAYMVGRLAGKRGK